MSMCGMHGVSYLTTEERMVLDEAGLLQTSFSLYPTLPNCDTISSWLLLLSPEKRPIQRSAMLGKKRNFLQQKMSLRFMIIGTLWHFGVVFWIIQSTLKHYHAPVRFKNWFSKPTPKDKTSKILLVWYWDALLPKTFCNYMSSRSIIILP